MAQRVQKVYAKKPEIALDKHLAALKNTDFESCAPCPGCAGKLVGERISCSRAGAVPVLIEAAQALACDGSKPKLPKKPAPIFVSKQQSLSV